jgi:glycosyltransferase involved in cell wall biosynthesis
LRRVLPALEELHRELPLSLSVISNSVSLFEKYTAGAGVPLVYHEWDRESFPHLFRRHDVCVLPVNVNPLTVCKTNNRLVLSLLLGVPVVADRIPSYEEFGDFVLFSDWRENLRRYALDPGLRRRHVRRGREYIRSKYNRERVVAQWGGLFRMLLDQTCKTPEAVST